MVVKTELTEGQAREAVGARLDDSTRTGSSRSGSNASTVDLQYQIIEAAWSLKSTMCWVRNDRNRLNAFRWSLSDRFGIGHPPSKVEGVAHTRVGLS